MLRTIPNNTGASLQQAFGPAGCAACRSDGAAVVESERLRAVAIDGTLTIRSDATLYKIALTGRSSRRATRPAVSS